MPWWCPNTCVQDAWICLRFLARRWSCDNVHKGVQPQLEVFEYSSEFLWVSLACNLGSGQ